MEPGVLGVSSDSSGIQSPSAFVSLAGSSTANAGAVRLQTASSTALDSVPTALLPEDPESDDDEAGDLLTKLQHLSLSGPTLVRSWGFSNYLGRSSTIGIILAASKMLRQLHGPSQGLNFKPEITPKVLFLWLSRIYESAERLWCRPVGVSVYLPTRKRCDICLS